MTTVGYGDRVPTFVVSKLISVVWILMGITVIATFTGSITAEISGATTIKPATMNGKRIGIMKGRLYEASVVVNKGGHVIVTKSGE